MHVVEEVYELIGVKWVISTAWPQKEVYDALHSSTTSNDDLQRQ